MNWVVQRVVDGHFFNGFRSRSWSPSIVSAIAFGTKAEASAEMLERGWQGVVYLALPEVRR